MCHISVMGITMSTEAVVTENVIDNNVVNSSPPATPRTDTRSTDDLVLAAEAIFGGSTNETTLSDGSTCIFYPARMEQLPSIIEFFELVLGALDKEMVGALVEVIADRQQLLMSAGGNPNKVDVKDMSSVALVHKVFGQVSLFATLFAAVFKELPALVEKFTNVSGEQFKKMHPDDGMLIAGGIFMVNYSFFSRSLPPILMAFMRSWASHQVSKVETNNATKKVLRRNR